MVKQVNFSYTLLPFANVIFILNSGGGEKMNIKQTLATAGTVVMLGMALTGSAFANYDGNGNWQNKHMDRQHSYKNNISNRNNWNRNTITYASTNTQSDNDWGNYDNWWSARGNNWDGNRNMNADWNDYVSWSEQNNLSWLTTRGKDWEYNDFQNWWNNHMNNGNSTNSENCNH